MPKVLSEEQISGYRKDGFVAPIPIFSADEVKACRDNVEHTEATMTEFFRGIGGTKFYLRFPWAFEMATHPKLLDAVEDLIGPNIMIYHNTAWIKEPEDDAYVSWHQDNTFFGHDPCEVLTAWVALSPATKETGCLQFMPGTHKGGLRQLNTPDIGGKNMLSSGQNVDVSEDQVQPVPIILQPGEISIHHAFLVHGSLPNKGNDRRMGITFIYHPPNIGQLGEDRTSALLVRGEDRFDLFDHEQAPIVDDDAGNAARHEQAVSAYRNKVRELGNRTVDRFD
ncbi:MAG: phytanoyl-CoA dioxygenase [Rhodospirillaceae bacterium]|nr:phytanoyl-CoA dioxygenase [Rhodospirillaceae bacterium]|tara:strand:- start:13198 stop:14040 length:843 start_codon:yes stop_codon:yes gene_type:complete